MIEFAKSMAGHDRNHIYLVTGKDERFVYLADGNVKYSQNTCEVSSAMGSGK